MATSASDDPPPAIFDGQRIAQRYRLGPLLGQGGQGTTYLALDEETGERVAVKSFNLATAESWKELELFERECLALRTLDYHGIPSYRGDFQSEDGNRAYLVMEYVEGRSLRSRVRRAGPIPEAEAWSLLRRALPILAYLHEREPPVVHRDIKPNNLIERPDGTLALVDFGGVRLRRRPNGGSTVVGTLGYLAPEQLFGEATARTDLYSLGATLVSLLTGREPEDLPRRGLKMDLKSALHVSPRLLGLLSRMTAPDPVERPASASALLAELDGRASTLAPRPDSSHLRAHLAMTRPFGRRRSGFPLVLLFLMLWVFGSAPLGFVLAVAAAIFLARRLSLVQGPRRPGRPLSGRRRPRQIIHERVQELEQALENADSVRFAPAPLPAVLPR